MVALREMHLNRRETHTRSQFTSIVDRKQLDTNMKSEIIEKSRRQYNRFASAHGDT